MSEAKGELYLRMEERDLNVTAKLTFTGTSYSNVIEILQTVSQVGVVSSGGGRQAVLALFPECGIQDAGC